ncbi:hypothetical protein GSI_13917 [Ganoderma sinense ZZ0214-1]|uniref:N-acetyltransferase ECO1 n=1 Tax=Ganoderma sinense ZZ0214-1 TaxID=1077348 RepID=A0A2G8RRM1_9APHY|nr:hypothetical protein GSI_13917 [Ganoderma sinense ZZ0214-1]
MSADLRRTYSTRSANAKPLLPSSPTSELTSPPSNKRKRPFADRPTEQNTPSKKPRRALNGDSKPSKASKTKDKQPKLTQLHFSLDTPVLRTCPLCDLSYTRGAPDDESLHKAHCARVQRGLEWGKEETREEANGGVEELHSNIKLRNGLRGRIICFRAEIGGKIGTKLSVLLETIRLALSSPALSKAVLHKSKIYVFLASAPGGPAPQREKIVGCVVAQRISSAMAIAHPSEVSAAAFPSVQSTPSSSQSAPQSGISSPTPSSALDPASRASSTAGAGAVPAAISSTPALALLPVDDSTNLYVHPTLLPTSMGVPRLFVSSEHRRLGIASRLLSVAAATFIHGCPLNPARGHIAFTQPTGAGKAVLEAWGKGGVRIYEEEANI